MKNIQKKSLQHISNTLKSVDTYPIYSVLIKAMIEAGCSNSDRTKILEKYQTAMSELMDKVREAKNWADAIVSDIE